MAMVFAVIGATGCPSKSTIDKAFDYSQKIDLTAQSAQATAQMAFAENLLTVEQNSYLAPKLQTLTNGAQAFRNAVITVKMSGDTGKVQMLNTLFSEQVVTPFLDVLKDLNLIKNAPKLVAVIGLIRVAVLAISQAFGKTETVARIDKLYERADLPT